MKLSEILQFYKDLGKRFVCLALSVEMSLAPVAMAAAVDPWDDLRPETPVGEEVMIHVEEDTPSHAAHEDPVRGEVSLQAGGSGEVTGTMADAVRLATNVSATLGFDFAEDEETGGTSMVTWFTLDNSNDRLKVELTSDYFQNQNSIWWLSNPFSIPTRDAGYDATGYYYFVPDPALNGRVPDMEFLGDVGDGCGYFTDGRPLFQDGKETAIDDTATLNGIDWSYYLDSIGYSAASAPVGAQIIRLAQGYQNTEATGAGGNAAVIEAQWAPSSKAEVTALGITLHGTSVNTTQVSTVFTVDPDPLTTTPAALTAAMFPLSTVTGTALPGGSVHGDTAGTEIVKKELYLWVGKDQKTLDLDFQTFEPFLDYTKDSLSASESYPSGLPVEVTYAFGDSAAETLPLTRGDNLTCAYYPKAKGGIPQNSPENPARGQWRVTGVPLVTVEQKTNEDGGIDTVTTVPETVTITLTVTAPDGESTKSYIIHVQRRKDPTGSAAFGNTPFGMLEREPASTWGSQGRVATLGAAKEAFLANGRRFVTAGKPASNANQGGNLYAWSYTNCWKNEDLDLDPTAIVAYQDSVFADPGVSFTDSIGRPVDLSNPLYQGTVTRSVQLKAPKDRKLSADTWTLPNSQIDTLWYDGNGGFTDDVSASRIPLTTLRDEIDLRGLPVLPGVYTITYVYTDPMSSTSDLESGAPTYEKTITRALVILPIPGDVDMDGAVTMSDGLALRDHMETWHSSTTEMLLLGRNRVFDLNGNGSVEEADYNAILTGGYQPELVTGKQSLGTVSDYFYLPLPSSVASAPRKTWGEVEDASGSGTLTLEYLGVETGKVSYTNTSFGATVNPGGPWATKKSGDTLEPVSLPALDGSYDNSIFWMGVKLQDSPRNGQNVEAFSISLIYDSTYVEPAQIYTASDKEVYEEQFGGGSFPGLLYTIRKYNTRDWAASSADGDNRATLWAGKNAYYTSSVTTHPFQTHYSKVISDLEAGKGDNTSALREVVFTLESTGAGNKAKVTDGYLLVIPFRLKIHPRNLGDDKQARLVELGAGMRDFTVITSGTSTAPTGFLAGLFDLLSGGARSSVQSGVGAYSAQDDIYGRNTANIREEITFQYTQGKVPVGQDNTVRKELSPGTYGDSYSVQISVGSAGQNLRELPPGLTYAPGTGIISGIPTKPGTYEFELNGSPYRIRISKRQMHIKPDNASTFYGETEYRGNSMERDTSGPNRNFTFKYYVPDLCALDRAAAAELGINLDETDDSGEVIRWRSGDELDLILRREYTTLKGTFNYNYVAPQFSAYEGEPNEQQTNLVTQRTPVHSSARYVISYEGNASSDTFVFTQDDTALLKISPRPVLIDYIWMRRPSDSGLIIYNDTLGNVSSATADSSDSEGSVVEIVLRHARTIEDENHLPVVSDPNGRPLTGSAKVPGDRISIAYKGTYIREGNDTASSFVLGAKEEPRFIRVDSVELTGISNTNYDLISSSDINRDACQVRGMVRLRGVSSLEWAHFPSELQEGKVLRYGASIGTPSNLQVTIVQGTGAGAQSNGSCEYNDKDMARLGVHFNWVTEEEYLAGKDDTTTLVGTGVDENGNDLRPYGKFRDNYLYPDMTGMRVCACVSKYGNSDIGEAPEYIKRYTAPITVTKKPLTIVPLSHTNYYGEVVDEDELDFSFSISQLVGDDQSGAVRGSKEVLQAVLSSTDKILDPIDPNAEPYTQYDPDFVMPTFEIVNMEGNPVVTRNGVQGLNTPFQANAGRYQLKLSGGQSAFYDFEYKTTAVDEVPDSAESGTSLLIITPRPIVVDQILGARNPEDGSRSFANIYADTKSLVVTGLYASYKPTDGSSEVIFTLPEYNTAAGYTRYYTSTSTGGIYTDSNRTFAANTTTTVLPGDDVGVKYQLTFIPDNGHPTWINFTNGYFANAAFTNGVLDKPVQVEHMEISGRDAGNYELVYKDINCVTDLVPYQALSDKRTGHIIGNYSGEMRTYYVSGTGKVYLRPIKNIILTSLGKMDYTYGDQYSPDQGMTIRVEYDTKYDNYPKSVTNPGGNDANEILEYSRTGATSTTFSERGFQIGFVKGSETMEQARQRGQFLTAGDLMTPKDHNGVAIFVVGRRSERDPLIFSKLSTTATELSAGAQRRISVEKASITLRAQDAHRLYGENNPTSYHYTFNIEDLTEVDRTALLSSGKITAYQEEADETVLQAMDASGVANLGLRFSTTATSKSPVGENGGWGRYDLYLTNSGDLSNYTVTTENADLYIYPRPIYISHVVSDADHPVYTIFHNTAATQFTTNISTDTTTGGGKGPYASIVCGSQVNIYTTLCADGVYRDLPITTTMGLVGGDVLHLKMTVGYPAVNMNDETNAVVSAEASFNGMVDTDSAGNYILMTKSDGYGEANESLADAATRVEFPIAAALKLRSISSIILVGKPNKMTYTYGEKLDLTGLTVRVNYVNPKGDQAESVDVEYQGYDQFLSYGLYVNYWNFNDPVPVDTTTNKDIWRALPNNYRIARSGDHLTIAPTHDTQRKYPGTTVSAENGHLFSANGMGLIISAYQAGSGQTPVSPVILRGKNGDTGLYTDGDPLTFSVNPLRLQYTLSATDKTYDGDTRTAGTLTLTNIYDTMGAESDPYNTAADGGVTDVVYVPIGAAYEGQGAVYSVAGYASLRSKIRNNRVSFVTGEYVPNQEFPMGLNGYIRWANGYTWGGSAEGGKGFLTFSFVNPNVHYVDNAGISGVGPATAAYWRNLSGAYQAHNTTAKGGQWDKYTAVNRLPVEVTNMVLRGPDAANYTWSDSHDKDASGAARVRLETRSAADGGQAAAPMATIHRANRAPIQSAYAAYGASLGDSAYPTVQVDQHTNVVRVYFDEAENILSKVGNLWNSKNRAANVTEAPYVSNDAYQDELHFEYTLLYKDANGMLRQWAGTQGDKAYQDTLYFGGETVLPSFTPGYLPRLDKLPKNISGSNTVLKGQRYVWAQLDNGLSRRGYREDEGVILALDQYPGGATLYDQSGNPVSARDAFWFYDLYKPLQRRNLPRDTIFYPAVRLAGTHNYNPSGALTGNGSMTMSPEAIDAALKAVAAYDLDPTNPTLKAEAQRLTNVALTEGADLTAEAKRIAQEKELFDLKLGATNSWPKEQPASVADRSVAVKTYRQRLDVLSSALERSQDNTDNTEYVVETLEAVWFTDTLYYPEERYLNAVLYNYPTRYYGYYWDIDLSARFDYQVRGVNFTEEIYDIPIRKRLPDKSIVEDVLDANLYDADLMGYVAKVYVQVEDEKGSKVRAMQIQPTALHVRLGDAPYQLTVITLPQLPSNRRYTWTSSDPAVATVDENGLVTFRGVGTCTITVSSDNYKSSSITVTVLESTPLIESVGQGLFNFVRTEAWMGTDDNRNFRPHEPMTRAQTVELLDKFLNPVEDWDALGKLSYVDVTGSERYAGALRRLTAAGVVQGVPGSAFAGANVVTRAEFTTMLCRMLQIPVADTRGKVHVYLDAGEEDTWAYSYIDAISKTGVVRGVGGGNFAPGRALTREEAAAVLARLLTVKVDLARDDLFVPGDVTPANWSYGAIVQAVNNIVFPAPGVN